MVAGFERPLMIGRRMTRRGGYDPEVNRMARVVKKADARKSLSPAQYKMAKVSAGDVCLTRGFHL